MRSRRLIRSPLLVVVGAGVGLTSGVGVAAWIQTSTATPAMVARAARIPAESLLTRIGALTMDSGSG
jgi:hypothetical protein